MLQFKEFNNNLECIKTNFVNDIQLKDLYKNLNDRDIRIIKLNFEGDIAQLIIKPDGFLIKLYPIACIFISKDPRRLILLNTDTFEVNEYCNYMLESEMKITKLSIISFIENLLSFHSDNLDTKIKLISSRMSNFTFDNIESRHLTQIAKIFHELLLLKNQYQEIRQTLTQINEIHNDKLKIINDLNKLDEFTRIINIYQNQFEEDVKNLSRMAKEIEILIQMTEIKFAERRNKIAVTSLNLDIIILGVSIISMFGSIFGMNLNSGLENIGYGLYLVLFFIIFLVLISYKFIRNQIFNNI
jgi:hypothetical protein